MLLVGISSCKSAAPFRGRKFLLMLARIKGKKKLRSGAQSVTSSRFGSHALVVDLAGISVVISFELRLTTLVTVSLLDVVYIAVNHMGDPYCF